MADQDNDQTDAMKRRAKAMVSPTPASTGDLSGYNQGKDYQDKTFWDKAKDLYNGVDPYTNKAKK